MSFHSLPTQCSAPLRARLVGKAPTTTPPFAPLCQLPRSVRSSQHSPGSIYFLHAAIYRQTQFSKERNVALFWWERALQSEEHFMTLWLSQIIWLLYQGMIMHHSHMWCLRTLLLSSNHHEVALESQRFIFFPESQKCRWSRCMYIAAG